MTTHKQNRELFLLALISRAETELTRLLGWVRAAESRIALVLPLSTAMLSALAVLAPAAANWTVAGGIASSISALFLLLGIIFAATASFPRTTGPEGSLIYFGGITSRDLDQYEAEVRLVTSESYFIDLIQQCNRNAQIAERKYTWVQRSMGCLLIATLPWLISLFIFYSAKP